MSEKFENFKWNVLPTPEHEGWNDHSASEFREEKLKSVVRECIQNSIDARENKRQPVKIAFEEIEFMIEDIIPDYTIWRKHALRAIDDAEKLDNENIKRAAKNARKFIDNANTNKIKVLKISDANTCGLEGVKEKKSRFDFLLKRKGSSVNQGVGGGQFGVGKFAPFPLSPISTVVYSSKNKEGEYGFALKTILQSYPLKEPVYVNGDLMEFAKGTWWFWDKEDNCGINSKEFIKSKGLLRDEVGTDIYVIGMEDKVGFDDNHTFTENIIKEICENYFMAFTENKLICDVIYTASNGKRVTTNINRENVHNHSIESCKIFSKRRGEYPKQLSHMKYKAAIALQAYENEVIELNVKHLGKTKLYLKFNPKWNDKIVASNHLFRARLNHQTIDCHSYGSNMCSESFVGCVIFLEEKGNRIIGRCEPPRHDKIKPSNITHDRTEKRKATEGLKDLKDQLQQICNERDKSSSKSEEIVDCRFIFGETEDPDSSLRLEIEDKITEFKSLPPNEVRIEGLDKPTDPPVPPVDPPVPPVDPPVPPVDPRPKRKKAAITSRRSIYVGNNSYNLVFYVDKDVSNAGIEMYARSDDYANEIKMDITEASYKDKNGNKQNYEIKQNTILVNKLYKDKNIINIKTSLSRKLALDMKLVSLRSVGGQENE